MLRVPAAAVTAPLRFDAAATFFTKLPRCCRHAFFFALYMQYCLSMRAAADAYAACCCCRHALRPEAFAMRRAMPYARYFRRRYLLAADYCDMLLMPSDISPALTPRRDTRDAMHPHAIMPL